jgi:peptidoglycan/LPS O-acetylase OafA/YrhL
LTRVLPFFSGVLLAHILDQKTNLNKRTMELLLGFSLVVITFMPFSFPAEKHFGIIYGLLLIFAVTFLIYACHKGYGGAVNRFLSSKFWFPISKMSHTIYLFGVSHQGFLLHMKSNSSTGVNVPYFVRIL